jgi:hypothetical protein
MNAAGVCRAFETSRRREDLSFQHHAEVAALPPDEADALLADLANETVSVLSGETPRGRFMPLVLLAGTVQSPIPSLRKAGRDARLSSSPTMCCFAWSHMTLQPGDAVSIQGALMLETRRGQLSGLFIVAGQVLPLRKRSISRAPMAAMAWAGGCQGDVTFSRRSKKLTIVGTSRSF